MKRLFIIMVCILTVFAGCRTKKATTTNQLAANRWHLDEIVYDGSDFSLTPPSGVTIIFSDTTDQISGRGGCNNFFGTYTRTGEQNIKLIVAGSTMMMCGESEMEFEHSYFQLLGAVDTYTVTDRELKLNITADGTTLIYKPELQAYE